MSRYVLDHEQLTPQACKRRAAELLADSRNSNLSRETVQTICAEAQVWATLATVPEPLEEVHGQIIDASPQSLLPVLTCPHGYQAQIHTIEAEGRPVQLRYTWRDCPNVSCP